MKYNLYGYELEISDERIDYIRMEDEYFQLACDLESKFIEDFESDCRNASEAVNNAERIGEKYFDEAIDYSLNKVTQEGIYSYGEEYYYDTLSEMGIMDEWDDELSDITEEYSKIEGAALQEINDREVNKELRGRFEGGGFGLEGAITGMATAGALNLITGAAYSVANSIGNKQTVAVAEQQKDELFQTICERLSDALFYVISEMYRVTIDVLHKEGINKFDIPSEDEEKKAQIILENYKANRIPQEKHKEAIVQIMGLDPLLDEVYIVALQEFGDADGEMGSMGEATGIRINDFKEKIIKDEIEDDLSDEKEKLDRRIIDSISYESSLLKIRGLLEERKAFYGVKYKTELDNTLDDEMSQIAMENRGVNGVVFDTIEEANKAKTDVVLFNEYIKSHGVTENNLKENILALPFQTSIITDNLDKEIELLLEGLNQEKFHNIIWNAWVDGLKAEWKSNYESHLYEHVFFPGKEGYNDTYQYISSWCNIDSNEIIAYIIYNSDDIIYEKRENFTCIILTNRFLRYYRKRNGTPEAERVIAYNDIKYIKRGRVSLEQCDGYTLRHGNMIVETSDETLVFEGYLAPRVSKAFEGVMSQSYKLLLPHAHVEKMNMQNTPNQSIVSNESNPVSNIEDCVKGICDEFLRNNMEGSKFIVQPKLRIGLELESDEIAYVGVDNTVFHSGKDGFAFTSKGIVCRVKRDIYRMTYYDFAKTSKLSWIDAERTELQADGIPIVRCFDYMSDSVEELVLNVGNALRQYI